MLEIELLVDSLLAISLATSLVVTPSEPTPTREFFRSYIILFLVSVSNNYESLLLDRHTKFVFESWDYSTSSMLNIALAYTFTDYV
jgi:hypothetical protein